MAEKKARGVGGCKVWGAKRDCFGFRFSPFRFPGLGPTQEGPWPVHVSCVETFTQFSFHRPCTGIPRHARVRARAPTTATCLVRGEYGEPSYV